MFWFLVLALVFFSEKNIAKQQKEAKSKVFIKLTFLWWTQKYKNVTASAQYVNRPLFANVWAVNIYQFVIMSVNVFTELTTAPKWPKNTN